MTDRIPEKMDDASALGDKPVCYICKKRIREGEYIRQLFTGKVKFDMTVEEYYINDTYEITHINCANPSVKS